MIEFVQSNWVEILAVIGALHALAKPLVAMTETKADDKVLALVTRVLRVIGLQPKGKS